MALETWLQLPVLTLVSLTTLLALVSSQDEEAICSNIGNYTREGSYRADLKALLDSLSTNIGDNGFYNASVGQVNAIALCRADIQLATCRGCISIASNVILQLCPVQVEAILWKQLCMVRYSNQSIFGKVAYEPHDNTSSLDWPNSKQYDEVRGPMLDDLRTQAAKGGALRKAAAGNKTTADNKETFYALVQCTPDLSAEDCASCLADAIRQTSDCCTDTVWVIFYKPSCTLRFDNDPFVNISRLQEPLEPLPSGNGDDHNFRNIIIIVVTIVVLVIVAPCVCLFVRKRTKQKKNGEPKSDEISDVESIRYDFGVIKAATHDFSDTNKLGQGGFGSVYKGELQEGQEIAVKRLSLSSCQGEKEFKNEVLILAKLQHKNLVRLLGFSTAGIEKLLVYEFVRNMSLDRFIFDAATSASLDWDIRYKIIGGIARGLLYLHEDSRLQIIHRDLKASNILLDQDMNPKISDFGLAKLVEPNATHEGTSRVVGTQAYMAPEYVSDGLYSIKSDVYSFGVLVMEIVTGQKKTYSLNDKKSGDLINHAWRSWREQTSASMIDPVLMANSSAKEGIQRCIHMALLCVQEDPDKRPTMSSVVIMLNSSSLSLPLPSEPGFYVQSSFSKALDSQGQTESSRSSKTPLN